MLDTMEMGITEAAERLHISTATVRRRIRNGLLNGHQEPTPQGFVWVVELTEEGPGPAPPAGDLVSALEARIAAQEHELENRVREISELHRLLAQSALNAAPTRPWWRFWR